MSEEKQSRERKKGVTGKAFSFTLLRRVLAYVRPYRGIFFLSLSISFIFAFLSLVRPLLMRYTVDNYILLPDPPMLLNMTMLMLVVLIGEALVQFADTYLTNWIGQSIIRDLRVDVYRHILSLRLKYFDNTPIGMLVTRAVSDIETIADIFSEGLIVIMSDVLKILVIVGVMFYFNVKLTLVCLSTIPILLVATNWFKNAIRVVFQDVRTQVSRLNTYVQEHITGMSLVQIFGREEKEMEKFEEINAAHRDANVRSVWYYSVFFPIVEMLSSASLALLVWWGGKGVLQGTVTPGDLMLFILFIHMLFRPIRQLADRFNTLQMGMVGSERVFKVLDTKASIENIGSLGADNISGAIEFKNVWFAYNDEDWVLRDISFSVKKGEKIALVGATGAGKSSVINLLGRFYEYNKGEILIDGKNIRDYELGSLKKNVGVVLQDVFLFSDTIANNISLNNPEITMDKIKEAAEFVGAGSFINRLPGNYQYNVMERGSTLSAGQRQLISFIRAYAYDPRILVLDEATSSIDTESEQLIQKATEKLTRGRTSIIIAHRLATIQNADRILVFEKGKLIEEGNHKELLEKGGQYRKLYEMQFREEPVA